MTAPEWTRRPLDEADKRKRWPESADRFERDDRRDVRRLKQWGEDRYDDPRPNAGYVHVDAGCTDWPDCDHPRHRRFECVRCGLGKTIGLSYEQSVRQQIKYACQACRSRTAHNPAGISANALVLFGEADDADAASATVIASE